MWIDWYFLINWRNYGLKFKKIIYSLPYAMKDACFMVFDEDTVFGTAGRSSNDGNYLQQSPYFCKLIISMYSRPTKAHSNCKSGHWCKKHITRSPSWKSWPRMWTSWHARWFSKICGGRRISRVWNFGQLKCPLCPHVLLPLFLLQERASVWQHHFAVGFTSNQPREQPKSANRLPVGPQYPGLFLQPEWPNSSVFGQ